MSTATEAAAVAAQDEVTGENLAPSMLDRDGVYIVGVYIGVRPRKSREVGEGDRKRTITPADIGLRVGGVIETIQADSEDQAREAVANARAGDRVAILAVNRSGMSGTPPRAWQFYTLARSSGSAAFASEFRD